MDTDEEGGEHELERNVNYLHDIMEKKKKQGKEKNMEEDCSLG